MLGALRTAGPACTLRTWHAATVNAGWHPSWSRAFARRARAQPEALPLALTPEAGNIDGTREWDRGEPLPPPRPGGYQLPRVFEPRGGAIPRLGSLRVPYQDGTFSPFEDPGAPPAGEPMEPDRSPPPWKVLRSHNGNLPIYLRFKRGGSEVSTLLLHFFGDIEHMRKELARVCESPVRVRSGKFEVRGMHTWKIKEWLTSLGM